MGKQSRWRSKAAWISATVLLLFALKTFGYLDVIGLTEESYKELTTLVFSVLTAFGIFNNPTNPEGF